MMWSLHCHRYRPTLFEKSNFCPKTTTFSRVFHPIFSDNFSREIKVEFFGQKMKIYNSVRPESAGKIELVIAFL